MLIRAGADVNAQSFTTGTTALLNAAEEGHVEVVRFLIAARANLNERDHSGDTALKKAASFPDPIKRQRMERMLRQAGARG